MSNSTSQDNKWTVVRQNYNVFYKYVSPILTCTAMVGCFGLLCVLVWKRKSIRFPVTTNMAICCLLTIDFLYLVSRFILWLGKTKITPSRLRDSHSIACFVWMAIVATLALLQSYVQCIISIELLIAVSRPERVRVWVTKARMIVALVLTITLGIALQIGFVVMGFKHEKNQCSTISEMGYELAIFDLITWLIVPGLILTICTIGIITIVTRRSRSYLQSNNRARINRQDVLLAMMLVFMDIVFIATCLPYVIVNYLLELHQDFGVNMLFAWDLSVYFTSFGTYTDWIIILVIGYPIRRTLKEMLCRRREVQMNEGSGSAYCIVS